MHTFFESMVCTLRSTHCSQFLAKLTALNKTGEACSFKDTPETSCITLWDGIQEKRTVNKPLKQNEITSLALMGEEALKRGPLLIGCDDGSIYRYDLRRKILTYILTCFN